MSCRWRHCPCKLLVCCSVYHIEMCCVVTTLCVDPELLDLSRYDDVSLTLGGVGAVCGAQHGGTPVQIPMPIPMEDDESEGLEGRLSSPACKAELGPGPVGGAAEVAPLAAVPKHVPYVICDPAVVCLFFCR